MLARCVVLAVTVVAVAACGVLSPAPPAPLKLGVSNGTTLDVSVFVNGRRVAGVAAGARLQALEAQALPPLPWHVQARSPGGRTLTSMTVGAGEVGTGDGPNGATRLSGRFGRVDLSCGRLTIWAGDMAIPRPEVDTAAPGRLTTGK